MRVLALGGAGEMGTAAVRVLADDPRVSRLVVADRDEQRASAVAMALGGKASARKVDVTDRATLFDAMRDCDLVVNTVGPFYRFGAPVLAAAIEAGRDYVDICDDPQPTLDMLAMDGRARAAGVTALLGIGASPGIANLLAVVAGRELDCVDSLLTGWNIGEAQPDPTTHAEASAALLHGIRQITGTIPLTRDGALAYEPALQRVRFTYPGIGPGEGRSFGHPEAVTLPRAFPELRDSTNIVVGNRAALAGLSLLRAAVDRGILSPNRAARLAGWAERHFPANPVDIITPGGMPPLFAIAAGRRDGRPASAATALAQIPGLSMAANTGIPLAVAVPMVADAARPGVHTPESLLEPDAFFSALAPHCIGHPAATAMTATTRSWDSKESAADALNTSLLTAFLAPPTRAGF
ncbi:saccharopine dehydrogenase family protein [Mycolicibacterium wolinskyi]|uniref:saccharopine dehydrogenase family protein n=1 Tax=Mycolicibacterium wolinskyi TaxID=59750 RepID=UPI0039179D3A